MTAGYFDASLLLAAVLAERGAGQAASLWVEAENRLASDLLRFECTVALRRAAILQDLDPGGAWASERLAQVERFFAGITFKAIDASIENVLRENPGLARCRCLDAIHLATALYFRPQLGEPLAVCTLDRRLREAAQAQGFQVLPAKLRS
jgi:predicted nucleic acid-binding protein